MIFDNDITKGLIEYTSKFNEDNNLCEDVARVIFVVFDSLEFQFQVERFFHEIGEFKSTMEILSANSKSKVVCKNIIKLASGLALSINKNNVAKMFVESGGVEAINAVLREQKESGNVVKLCVQLLRELPPDKGKSTTLLLLLLFCLVLQWIIGINERLNFDTLTETSEVHKDDLIITEIVRDIAYKHGGESGKKCILINTVFVFNACIFSHNNRSQKRKN